MEFSKQIIRPDRIYESVLYAQDVAYTPIFAQRKIMFLYLSLRD